MPMSAPDVLHGHRLLLGELDRSLRLLRGERLGSPAEAAAHTPQARHTGAMSGCRSGPSSLALRAASAGQSVLAPAMPCLAAPEVPAATAAHKATTSSRTHGTDHLGGLSPGGFDDLVCQERVHRHIR